MLILDKKSIREKIGNFYCLHRKKGKIYTYRHFKPYMGRTQMYELMTKIDLGQSIALKSVSGRPKKLSPSDSKKLKNFTNHKTGVSQRKLADNFKVIN